MLSLACFDQSAFRTAAIQFINALNYKLSRFPDPFFGELAQHWLYHRERRSLITHSSSLFTTATVLDFSFCVFSALGGPWRALQTGCINVRAVSERLLILEGDKEPEPTAELNNEDTVCRERSQTPTNGISSQTKIFRGQTETTAVRS